MSQWSKWNCEILKFKSISILPSKQNVKQWMETINISKCMGSIRGNNNIETINISKCMRSIRGNNNMGTINISKCMGNY